MEIETIFSTCLFIFFNFLYLLAEQFDINYHFMILVNSGLDLLEMEVVAIIGPQASEVAEFILHLGTVTQVPVVSFSVTNPSLSHHRFPYFVRMTHSDALQMRPIAALAQAYGWRRVTAVYSDDEFGSGAVSSLIDALRDVGSELESTSISDQEDIGEMLSKLQTMESRVFVTHMQSDLASKILVKASQMGMMDSGYVWITTDEVTSLWDVLLDDSTMVSLQGLVGVKTYINQKSNKLRDFTRRWRHRFRLESPDLYGLLAYDSVSMIARAIGKFENKSFNFSKPISPTQLAVENTTDFTQRIKVFHEGQQLLQELLRTNFTGLSGVVQLQDGEIVGSTYEIVNVVGKSYQIVGYWNNETQLSKQHPFAASAQSGQNNIIDKLRNVIWPGESLEVPRGWVQPNNGKTMKIAVPNRTRGFTEFLNVAFDKSSNQGKVTGGFCIDVFDAVLSRLDFALPYELIPYGDEINYDDLVFQVYLKVDSIVR
jgi:ionotropic glutamate receptor